MALPVVLVTADARDFDGYVWHAAPATYLKALVNQANTLPIVLPAFGPALDLDALLDRVDGVLVTGSRSNVHPSNYGQEPTSRHEPYDEARDATSLPLIRRAIERGVPLIGICRGIQDMNVALGGSLATEIQEQEGVMDHRTPKVEHRDEKYQIRQEVAIQPGGCLAEIINDTAIKVNSLHRQAIDQLAEGLHIEALAPDGVVEAVSVIGAKGFALGVQWHPEYWAASDGPSSKIFEAFGRACRQYQEAQGRG